MSTSTLACVQITLAAPDDALESCIEDALWCAEIDGLERQDDETWSALVEDPRPRDPGTVRWRVFAAGVDLATLRQSVDDVLQPYAQHLSLDGWIIDDLSFMETWRQFFKPAHVSPRIVVHPPWEIPDVEPGVHRVMIEPGMAFGTGTHETTRMCIKAIDDLLARSPGTAPTVLDVGTGSGILSFAATLLGAGEITGIENDPDALIIARENARLNRIAERIHFPDTQVDELAGPYDIVLANILPHILGVIREHLVRLTRPGGFLVLSGILHTEKAALEGTFAGVGLSLDSTLEMGDWCSLVYRREQP